MEEHFIDPKTLTILPKNESSKDDDSKEEKEKEGEENKEGIKCILDVAHNIQGMNKLFQIIKSVYPKDSYSHRVIVGFGS